MVFVFMWLEDATVTEDYLNLVYYKILGGSQSISRGAAGHAKFMV